MRRVLFSLVVLATSCLIGLGVAEGTVRLYTRLDKATGRRLREIDPYAIQIEPHGQLGYRQRPNSRFHYPTTEVVASANSLGFRGPEISIQPKPGTFRIVLLGGSTTHGWGVRDHETIDAHMRRLLVERYPGRTFEVINLAFDGYDNLQNLERLRSDGLRFSPNVVILNDGINDVRNAWLPDLRPQDPRTLIWERVMVRLRREQAEGLPLWTYVKHYSVAARIPGFIRDQRRLTDEVASKMEIGRRVSAAARSGALTTNGPHPPYPEAADFFERYAREIVKTSLGAGASVVLSTPSSALRTYADTATSKLSYWVINAKTTQRYRDELAARLQRITADEQEVGHPVRYVAPRLADPKLYLDDCHLTSDGNAAEAALFVEALAPFIAGHRHR